MSNVSAKEKWLGRLTDSLGHGSFVKLTLAGYRGRDSKLKNVFVRQVELREGPRLSFVYRYANRDVTKNLVPEEGLALLTDLVGNDFRHAHLFSTDWTSELEFRDGRTAWLREGKPVHSSPPDKSHDRTKVRTITAENSPWLQRLGVVQPNGRVVKGMEGKLRQINKFVELLAPLFADAGLTSHSTPSVFVVDMGCGKGYLTFAAHDWLQQSGFAAAQTMGIEARPELVDLCNSAAQASGFAGLRFHTGSIATIELERVHVLIALHACDTATDDAIARGIKASAELIVVSPCCHKELRPQLSPAAVLAPALRHGIFREREAEFVTDALRAALLEWAGYETRVFEFISTEHTAKNLMIAGIKRKTRANLESAADQVRELAKFYGVTRHHLASRIGFPLVAAAALSRTHD